MKIAIDISQIVYQGTGVDTYTRNLVKELLRLNSTHKHDYILFGTSLRRKHTLDQYAQELMEEGLKFKTSFWLLPPTFTNQIWNQIHHVRIERLIGKIDLFHSSDWVQPPTRAKKVTTIHDLVVYKHPQSSHSEITSVQKRKLHWVKKECDAIIVDSEATKKDCQEILKIPQSKMHVVYLAAGNSVDDFVRQSQNFRKEQVENVRRKYHLTKPYILAVGTREPRKNLDRLIKSASKIPEVNLVIAGKFGWGDQMKNDNFRMINVNVLGYVPEQDMPALYSGAECYVHPSLYEGFGVTVLEAMTLGVPVVTSKASSLPEAGGEAALYVNPKNTNDIESKIKQVLTLSQKGRSAIISKGLKQASKFSWEKTALETLNVYEKVYGDK